MSQIDVPSTGGGGGAVDSVTGSFPINVAPTTGNSIVSIAFSTTSAVGAASFDPSDFSVDGSGHVSLLPAHYVNVTNAMSPYTVTEDDYFISIDATDGAVTINLPDTPFAGRQFIIKDRLGKASSNTITIKSLTGASTIDQQASYDFIDNFESLECLYHSANYEVF